MMDSTKKARETMINMLKKRGYQIEQISKNTEIKPLVTQNDNKHKIIVFFSKDSKVGIAEIRHYIEIMKTSDDEINHAIIILKGNVSSSAKKATANSKNFNIELFSESELQFDLTEHKLQPKFTMLSETERTQLLEDYNIKPTQLPRMLITDPIARYYGAKRGNVFKIERPSETAGRYTTYRIVI